MSNYKDICDFSTNTQQRSQAFTDAEEDAPSVPWSELSFLGQTSRTSSPVSADDLGLNLEGNQASLTRNIAPRAEFIRAGNLDKFYSGSRIVKIYPQQFVYNFPATKRDSNRDITYTNFIDKDSIFEVGTRDIIFPVANRGIRLPPSENRENYHSQESVINVVNSQDPLRYCHGSIFLGNRIDADNRDDSYPQSWRTDEARFFLYNPFPKLREGLDDAPFEEGDFGAVKMPTFKMWIAASFDPQLRIEMTRINFNADGPGNGAEFFEYLPPGMPNGSEIKYFKKFKVRDIAIKSLAFRDLYPSLGWASGIEYLKNIIKENKTFYDFRFYSNAAFFEEEKDFFNVAPLNTVNIVCKIINPDLLESKNQKSITSNQVTTNQENSDYYEIGSVERTLPNIYREYLKANKDIDPFGQWQFFQDRNINVNSWLDESCNETNVEIYGTYEVRKMQEINNIILGYVEQEGQRFQERQRWISQYTNAFVEVSFKMPSSFTAEEKENLGFIFSHGDFASLGDNSQHPQRAVHAMDDPQVSTFLLSLMDYGFTDPSAAFGNYYDTITAFASEQFLYIDEDVMQGEDRAIAGSTIQNVGNEKTIFNYRPRTIDFRSEGLKDLLESNGKQYGRGNIIHTLQNLVRVMFPAGQSGMEETIKEHYVPSKYPLGYRGFHYVYDTDPARDSLFDGTRNFSDGLVKRFHNLANKTIQSSPSSVIGRNSYFFPYGRHDDRRDLGVDEWVRQKWKLLHPDEIFSAQKDFHSEIIAFRMEKINSNTGKVIKEYYFWNNQLSGDADFKYLDTQILAGAKYIYNIYAINLVLGAEYTYSNVRPIVHPARNEPPEPDSPPGVLVNIDYSPCFKVIETPYYSQRVSVIDLPPIYPTVELFKYEKTEQQEQSFMFKFSESLGTLLESPVPLLPEDEEIFQQARLAQQKSKLIDSPEDSNSKKIKFSSDTRVTHYEIFTLNEKPTSIYDFAQGEYFKILSSDLVFPFIPEPNKDKYFIFRSRDFNGVSNPTQIFKFRYNVYGDGDYYEFDLYEIEEVEAVDKMHFERFLSIEPTTIQKILTIPKVSTTDNPDDTVYDLSSAPLISNISFNSEIGAQLAVWGKKFKIRIKSRSTGKEIDFNIDFSYSKKSTEEEQDPEFVDNCPDRSQRQNISIRQAESEALTNIARSLSAGEGPDEY